MEVAVRCYVDTPRKKVEKQEEAWHNKSFVLAFDTETTVDEYQNLLYGSCFVYHYGKPIEAILFYNENIVTKEDIEVINNFAVENGYTVMTRADFVDKVFMKYVYRFRAECVGFNLPFDLSRLATRFTDSRKYENGFSLTLSEHKGHPHIVIKHVDSKMSFISFTSPLRKKSEKKFKSYRGFFIDLKTLAFALTNNSYSLESAAKEFDCERQKTHLVEYGKITEEALEYNVNDTLTTYELYLKLLERYQLYGLQKDVNKVYSPASIGKAYLEKIGVRPFLYWNPDFPKEVLGYVMSAYFGGRTEVRVRKQPIRISYIDFTSMYPTVYALTGMDSFLKADKINVVENTEDVQTFLDRIVEADLQNPDTWKKMPCICLIRPDNDILPVRAKYGNKHTYNIGLNYLRSDVPLWYSLADLAGSKMLTGKAPRILKALSFVPVDVQSGLRSINVLPNVVVRPKDDFIKTLIEERMKIKQLMKAATPDERRQLELSQNILKIIANSTSYGIFIQIDTKNVEEQDASIYGLDTFKTTINKSESEGMAFNPIMAITITACSRLILATAEALITKNNGVFAYCDTDSIFVSPEHVKMLQDFFKALNPYSQKDLDMFKVESDNNDKKIDRALFYGISAKRYVLYDHNPDGTITVRKFTSHGLGHLDGIDQEQVWRDILEIHYHPENKEAILQRYDGKHAVSQLTVSDYSKYIRFSYFNQGKPFEKQVKPFNFMTVGTSYTEDQKNGKRIIPMMPYVNQNSRKFEQIPYRPFVDYKTGLIYDETTDTQSYWMPLSEVIDRYIDHPELKLEGNIGILQRRHIVIEKNSIIHIGKESNELEESLIIGVKEDNYTLYHNISQIIKEMNLEKARQFGISKRNLYYLKEKAMSGVLSKVKSSTIAKLKKRINY